MKRSDATKHNKPRFGRHVSSIGARQMGADMRQARLRMIALVAQAAGTQSAQQRIFARRVMTGKRV